MKKYLLIILFFVVTISLRAQTGSIEMSTGGFSFVPAFTSREPNLIINAGTNPKRRLTGHIMYLMRLKSFTLNTVVLISRYKVINKKFKMIVGLHIPAMQLTDKYAVTSFFGQELTTIYPVNNKWTVGTFMLKGEGRNKDLSIALGAVNVVRTAGKWNFLSQAYYLNLGNVTGVAETITYDFNTHFQAKAFGNYSLSDGSVISTIGLKYNL